MHMDNKHSESSHKRAGASTTCSPLRPVERFLPRCAPVLPRPLGRL